LRLGFVSAGPPPDRFENQSLSNLVSITAPERLHLTGASLSVRPRKRPPRSENTQAAKALIVTAQAYHTTPEPAQAPPAINVLNVNI
jgi:hypothetical protein